MRMARVRPFAMIDAEARAVVRPGHVQMSSRVSLTGGARYINERKGLRAPEAFTGIDTTILAVPTSFYDFIDAAAFHTWTPKAGIQVQAAHDTFGYFTATRGFKSGGFNPGEAVAAKAAFGPEFAWSYEGGLNLKWISAWGSQPRAIELLGRRRPPGTSTRLTCPRRAEKHDTRRVRGGPGPAAAAAAAGLPGALELPRCIVFDSRLRCGLLPRLRHWLREWQVNRP